MKSIFGKNLRIWQNLTYPETTALRKISGPSNGCATAYVALWQKSLETLALFNCIQHDIVIQSKKRNRSCRTGLSENLRIPQKRLLEKNCKQL